MSGESGSVSVLASTWTSESGSSHHSVKVMCEVRSPNEKPIIRTIATKSCCQNAGEDSPDLARCAELALAEVDRIAAETRKQLEDCDLIEPRPAVVMDRQVVTQRIRYVLYSVNGGEALLNTECVNALVEAALGVA